MKPYQSLWLACGEPSVLAFRERGLRTGAGRSAEPHVGSLSSNHERKADTMKTYPLKRPAVEAATAAGHTVPASRAPATARTFALVHPVCQTRQFA